MLKSPLKSPKYFVIFEMQEREREIGRKMNYNVVVTCNFFITKQKRNVREKMERI